MERVSPNLSQAARSLGRSKREILVQIFLPLIKGSLGSALVLVFVDCVKELPATMLLRPFNFSTLATRTHDQASLENLPQAAPAALLIILVGLLAVGLLARASR
jgi:iron(III) transport system permease protein